MSLDSRAIAGGAAALGFGVYADLAYNIMSATNSSPQTTELFARDRAETLWKYVKIGDAQIVALSLFGAYLAGPQLWPYPLLGGAVTAVLMHCMYAHALKAGRDQAAPGTSSSASSGGSQLAWNNPT